MEEFVKSHFIFWFSAKFSSNFYIYSHLLKKLHNIMFKKVEKYADKKFKKKYCPGKNSITALSCSNE